MIRDLWSDQHGNVVRLLDAVGVLSVECDGEVDLPTDPDDKVRVLSDLADAMGMEWDGLREKARPFQVGDVVEHPTGAVGRVLAIGNERLFVDCTVTYTDEAAWRIDACTLITPAEEVEQGASA